MQIHVEVERVRAATSPRRVVVLLGAMSGLGALSIDMYLPAMPQMTEDLASSPATLQLTLTVFVVALAAGQLVIGPVSDAVGRRLPLLAGLVLYVLSSLASVMAPTVETLVAARVGQAIGAAAAAVLARAIVRDIFHGRAMASAMSTMMLVNGVAPVVAPVLGGAILAVAPWRVVFAVMSVIGLVLTVLVWFSLDESSARRPFRVRHLAQDYGALLRDIRFIALTSTAGLMFGAVFVYISSSSFVLQEEFDLSPLEFGALFAVNGLGIIAAARVNSALLTVGIPAQRLLMAALMLAVAGALACWALTQVHAPLGALVPGMFVSVSMIGPVLANATALALDPHAQRAGVASSLLGLAQFAIAAAATSVQGLVGPPSGALMFAAMACCAVRAWCAAAVFRPRTRHQP